MKRRAYMLLAIAAAAVMPTTACQATPTERSVSDKRDNLSGAIYAEASQGNSEDHQLSNEWKYDKSYKENKKLVVDAQIINNRVTGAPVVSVSERNFKNKQENERITKILYPGYDYKEVTEQLTKLQIEENIIMLKQLIAEAKREGDDINIPYYEEQIKSLESEYKTAPESELIEKADFNLKMKENGSNQANIVAVKAKAKVYINFIDWEIQKGSVLFLHNAGLSNKSENPSALCVSSELFDYDKDYLVGKEKIDKLLKNIGLDYFRIYSVSKYDDGYEYYYTRVVSEFPETYSQLCISRAINEEEQVMNLWKQETFVVRLVNGDIAELEWDNPSIITQIDNNNAKIISFDEAKDAFIKQMDLMLTPTVAEGVDEEYYAIFGEETEIHINKIELGLTKILTPNSHNEYKLIPTWSFSGYDKNVVDDTNMNIGATTCFVCVNALDGSIIDRGLMY